MEDCTKRYQISNTFKKTVALPQLSDWYNRYYEQLQLDDIIPIIIKTKGFIFDSTQKIIRRKIVLAKNGNLLIYTTQNEGFMLDPSTVQSETMRQDRYWRDGKYETYRVQQKLKFSFGTLNLFLVGNQIPKWRDHLDKFSPKKEAPVNEMSLRDINVTNNKVLVLKPSGLSVSNLRCEANSLNIRSLKAFNSFTPASSIRERKEFNEKTSRKLAEIKESLLAPVILESMNIPTPKDKDTDCDLKSDKSGSSIYSMDSVRRRSRTSSRSRIFRKSQEKLEVKEENPFEQLENIMKENMEKMASKETEEIIKDCVDSGMSAHGTSLVMDNLKISNTEEPISKKYGTFGVWVQKQAKEGASTSNLLEQINQ